MSVFRANVAPTSGGAAPGVVRVSGARVRRVPWIALGAVVMLVGALFFGRLVQSAGDRTAVLVAARDINPGQRVESGDLRLVDLAVDGDATVILAADRRELLGQVATARVPAGSVLSPEQFGADSALETGTVVIGVQLAPGGLPIPDLRIGDRVRLLEAAPAEGGQEGRDGDDEPLGTAEVYRVSPSAQPDALFVSLAVPDDIAQRVADVAAAQSLRLLLLPPGGGREG